MSTSIDRLTAALADRYRLERELGQGGMATAIRRALQDRLERESQRSRRGIGLEVRRVQERLARLPVLDPRPAEEIVGYDDHGVPR